MLATTRPMGRVVSLLALGQIIARAKLDHCSR